MVKFARAAALAAMAAAVLVAAVADASAQDRLQYDKRGRPVYGSGGPNVVYQRGPTRIYVTKRSWLDAGTEVLPGDRKFTDYAFPPAVSFARENRNRPIDRQPLNPPEDFGYGPGFNFGFINGYN